MTQRTGQLAAAQGGAKAACRSPFGWLVFPGCLLLCAGLLSGCREDSSSEGAAKPVAPVTVALPVEQPVTDFEEFTGRMEAKEKVEIRARVTGYLDKICFQEGAEVKQGDLLFEIDPRPFQARYDDALAQIKLCEANLKYRKAELARTTELLPKAAVSRSDYDQSVARHDQAAAALLSAQAAAEEAKLNLGFTKLYSPVDGEISRAMITKGNLVNADQTLLTTIVSVDPIYAYFDVDESTILQVQADVRSGKIKVDAKDKDQIPVQMRLDNEQGYPHDGFLDFMENRLNPNTGTIQIRGVFSNPKPAMGKRLLKPGNHANVRIALGDPYKALLVVDQALGTDQGQKYLLTVDDKNVVQYCLVTPGKLEGRLRVIAKGLKAKDRVIVSGVLQCPAGSGRRPESGRYEDICGGG